MSTADAPHLRMSRALRAALALVAVLVAAWFLVGARQAHQLDAATDLIDHQAGNSTRASDRTLGLLHSADFLLPGVETDLLRARLALQRRQYDRARRLIARATRSEPDDLQAWITALELDVIDPRKEEARVITAHLRALDPVDVSRFPH